MRVQFLCLLGLLQAGASAGEPDRLEFPTSNRALTSGQPEAFYMGVDRQTGRIWQGGSFGFTRAPMIHQGREIFTQFHEGTDIAPLSRDAGGTPQDEVRAMCAGQVVLAESRGTDSYGNQVVLRHDWSCGPVFTRYAHLNKLSVQTGDVVRSGQVLGVLGSSGGRFEAARAHLHLEVGLLIQTGLPEPERYRPMNWAVLNPEPLLLASQKGPVSIPAHVKELKVDFILESPAAAVPDLLKRHPWLAGASDSDARGWRIHCTSWGFPIRFEALAAAPAGRRVSWVRPQPGLHSWHTRQLLTGEGPTAALGPRGEIFLDLMMNAKASD